VPGRAHQDPVPVCGHELGTDRGGRRPLAQLGPDLGPHLPGQDRRRVGHRQVLAHGAAQLRGDGPDAVLERGGRGRAAHDDDRQRPRGGDQRHGQCQTGQRTA
jgi:hypothetical protein